MERSAPIKLAQIFFISIYSLAAFSGAVLAWAEAALFPVGLTVPFALIAYILNEQVRLVRLSGLWANLMGIVAVTFPAFEFFSDNPEGQLLAGAHLLVYLQWILLFQDKQTQQYWWICALSVLQIAVASVLTQSGWFGVYVGMYLLLSIWTVSVFSLYLATSQFLEAPTGAESEAPKIPLSRPPSEAEAAALRAKSIASRGGPEVSTVRNSVQHDPDENWINGRFVAGVLGLAGAAGALGLAFFLLIPRLWIGELAAFANIGDLSPLGRPVTGFAEQIRLGDLGEILESPEPVLEVRFFDHDSNRPLNIDQYALEMGYSEPLFRGTVMSRYSAGHWGSARRGRGPGGELLPLEPGPGMVRQEYLMQPISAPYLFAMPPVDAGLIRTGRGRQRRDSPIGLSLSTGSLFRPQQISGEISYILYSPRRRPHGRMSGHEHAPEEMSEAFRSRYLMMPSLERLSALAKELIQPDILARVPGQSLTMRKALAVEAHLRDSGKYTYSLDLSIKDSSIDPVEDFLFNRKSGNCEYYATALALMLRSLDIPSRIVSGFKGGIWNESGRYLEVQQRHAHVWVEAFIDNEWVTLDATPAAERQELLAEMTAEPSLAARLRSFFVSAWHDFVLNMSLSQQRKYLYEPLRDALRELWDELASARGAAGGWFTWLKEMLANPDRWFSWQGGAVAFVLMLLLSGLVALIRAGIRWFRQWKQARSIEEDRNRYRVEFFDRFARLMAQQGLRQELAQTQQEFANEALVVLGEKLQGDGLRKTPEALAEAFYRVRFGSQSLTNAELAQLSERLNELEVCLTSPEPPTHHNNGH